MLRPVFTLLLLLSVLTGAAHAQESAQLASRFFRITVTLNEKPLLAPSIFEDTAGSLIVKGAPLAQVISRAYGVKRFQLIDAPAWVDQPHLYDVEGVPPPMELVASDESAMLQAMLADRFNLQVRRETREVTMLVLDVDGPRQRELALEAEAQRNAPPREIEVRTDTGGRVRIASTGLFGQRPVSAQLLAERYAAQLGEPILAASGLDAIYVSRPPAILNAPPVNVADSVNAELALSGLILERRTVALDVVVVTAIERPVLDAVDK